MFTQLEIEKLNREQGRYETVRHRDGKPHLPKTTTLNNRIIQVAQKQGGVIAGSYALKAYNPRYDRRIGDVDVIAKNPLNFAEKLINNLNKLYNKDRFKVVRGVNAYRIYDREKMKYVADIVSYPINQKEYEKIQGVKIAQPEYVFKGKRKKIKTSTSFPKLKFDFSKSIRRLI